MEVKNGLIYSRRRDMRTEKPTYSVSLEEHGPFSKFTILKREKTKRDRFN